MERFKKAIENLIAENKELKSQLNKIKEIYFKSKDLEELDDSLGDFFNINIDTIRSIPRERFKRTV